MSLISSTVISVRAPLVSSTTVAVSTVLTSINQVTVLTDTVYRLETATFKPAGLYVLRNSSWQEEFPRVWRNGVLDYAGRGSLALPTLKSSPAGLMERFQEPDFLTNGSQAFAPLIDCWTIQVRAYELWPDDVNGNPGPINWNAPTYKGNTIPSGRTLMQDIAAARLWHGGANNRLRILFGQYAPNSMKKLGSTGAAMQWWDDTANAVITVGRWWLAAYKASYRAKMADIAAALDSEPVISEVQITGHMTVYGEMNRQVAGTTPGGSGNPRQSMVNALAEPEPYTGDGAVDYQSMRDYMQIHADLFTLTRSNFALNPAQRCTSLTNVTSNDIATTRGMIDSMATILGANGVVMNHSVRDSDQDSVAGNNIAGYYQLLCSPDPNSIYSHMQAVGQTTSLRVNWQTDARSRLGRLVNPNGPTPLTLKTTSWSPTQNVLVGSALDICLHFLQGVGGGSVELPSGYNDFDAYSDNGSNAHFPSIEIAQAYRDAFAAL